MKSLHLFLFLAALLSIFTGCSKRDPNILKIGMELTYPPFEMTDAEDDPDGISVRMAEALGQSLGRPIEIVNVGWDGIIAALRTGKIDLIISSMTKTEEREKSIAFSDPYVTNSLCTLVGKESTIATPEDLKRTGIRIAVKGETTGESYVSENLPKAEMIRLDQASDCVLQVMQGKADAFVYDQITIYSSWKAHPAETRAILTPIRAESWAIGLRQGENALRDQVNAFLKEFRAKKGFEALTERYMAEEKKAFQEQGIPFIFD
ncbi:MAG: polar amino acid transport system substrate-binding protein [Verrucomicrobiales bacterium]|jgi:polar amino acid transport system substrate-binding protein